MATTRPAGTVDGPIAAAVLEITLTAIVQDSGGRIDNQMTVTLETDGGDIPVTPDNPDTDTVSLYKVIYDADGADGAVPADPKVYAVGTAVTVLEPDDLQKDGCTFNCWSCKNDGADYVQGSTFEITGDTVLAAKWLTVVKNANLSISMRIVPNP